MIHPHERYIRVTGTARERGGALGRALRPRLRTLLTLLDTAGQARDGTTLRQWRPHARTLLPFIETHAARTLEEMEGLAHGAELDFDEILLLTCAYEKWMDFHAPGRCTGFAAAEGYTAEGGVVCGQTNDEDLTCWAAGQLDLVAHHVEPDRGLQTLIYTHPGIPAYMGMNSDGLCLLWMYIDDGQRRPGLPTNVVIREALRRSTLAAAVDFLTSVPLAVPNNFLLAHRSEGMCNIECFPAGCHPVFSRTALCHANHILSEAEARTDVKRAAPAGTTFRRHDRMAALLEENKDRIDLARGCEMLADHAGAPASVCVHPHPDAVTAKTLAAMVFDPAAGTMAIAFGNACETAFQRYSFDTATDALS